METSAAWPSFYSFTVRRREKMEKWFAVMERVREYSGIVSVSSYRWDEKSVHVASRDFHSLPTNPVISHKVIIQKTDFSLWWCKSSWTGDKLLNAGLFVTFNNRTLLKYMFLQLVTLLIKSQRMNSKYSTLQGCLFSPSQFKLEVEHSSNCRGGLRLPFESRSHRGYARVTHASAAL